MLRGIWGDDERFVETYWSQFPERRWCFTGVGAGYDDEDAIWIVGRDDDVMNASGRHISTAIIGTSDETGEGDCCVRHLA
jgi:acetyl-CoA synthetase